MKLTLGPNGDARDFLRLFTHPEEWASVRPLISEIALWHDKGRPQHTPRVFGNGLTEPNTYHALRSVDAFAKLKAWGIDLVLGQGATKPWDKFGDAQREQMHEAINGVEAAGGTVAGFSIDSATRAISATNVVSEDGGDGYLGTVERTADVVGNFIREARDRECWCAIAEPFPGHPLTLHLQFVDVLIARGLPPKRFIFDIDLQAFKYRKWWQRLLGQRPELDFAYHWPALRAHCRQLRARGVEPSITIMGSGVIHDQAEFARKTRDYSALMRRAFGDSLERIELTSWVTVEGSGEHPDHGEKWCPSVLPVSDRTSHLALVRDIAAEWSIAPLPVPPHVPVPATKLMRVSLWRAGQFYTPTTASVRLDDEAGTTIHAVLEPVDFEAARPLFQLPASVVWTHGALLTVDDIPPQRIILGPDLNVDLLPPPPALRGTEFGPIEKDGAFFRNQGQDWIYGGLTSFTLFQRWMDDGEAGVDAWLDLAIRWRAKVLRCFGMWAWSDPTRQRFTLTEYPQWADELPKFLAYVNSRGLRVEFVPLIDCVMLLPDYGQQLAHVQRVADLMASFNLGWNVLEIANEPWHPENGVDADRMARELRVPPGLLVATGNYEAQPFRLRSGYGTNHTTRDAEWMGNAKELKDQRDFSSVPEVGDEPVGADGDPNDGRSSHPEEFGDYAAIAALLGNGATFHLNEHYCRVDHITPVMEACAREFFDALYWAPPYVTRGEYVAGHLSNVPIEFRDEWSLRTFGRIWGADAWINVTHPHPAGIVDGLVRAQVRNGWRVVDRSGPHGRRIHLQR